MPPQKTIFTGRIGILNAPSQDGDLFFQYNPRTIRRARRAAYADNRAALADFPNSPASAIPAFEWQRNDAEEFDFELMLHRTDDGQDVEDELHRLDELMTPDPNSGRPRDLILVLGVRTDRIRILDKSVNENLFAPNGAVQSATVNMRCRALKSRSA